MEATADTTITGITQVIIGTVAGITLTTIITTVDTTIVAATGSSK